jgi:hypothetical protein
VERIVRKLLISGAVACGAAITACGSSSPTQPSAPALTQTQTGNLEAAFARVENSTLVKQFLVQFFNEANDAYNAGSTATSFPINVSTGCSDAGTAGLTGKVVEDANAGPGGKYSATATLAITFSKCTSGGIEIDGTLSSVGQINGDDTHAIINPVTFTISGSSSFVLNGVTGTTAFTCSNSVNVDFTAGTSSGITSGGNAILHYPTGKNQTTVPCSDFSSGFNGLSLGGV